jgi:hypothetical protein
MNSGTARMLTRREVLGAALVFATVSGAIGLNSACRVRAVKDPTALPKVGAMVLDEDLAVSTTLVDFLRNRNPDLSFRTIGLDSFASIELKHLFNSAQMIAGISSGATLFCLERIAWDYGYRITRRSEHEFNAKAANALENDATVVALAEKIISNKPESFAAGIAPTSRGYRPSRADDTLHVWIMQTAVTSKKRTV